MGLLPKRDTRCIYIIRTRNIPSKQLFRPERANFRSTIYKAVATILLPILGALFTWLILDTPQDTEQLIECFVPKGEKAKQIFLPDGSEVWVNAESILIYPNTFKGDTRTLFLNGEANFKVSRDKKSPSS